MNHQHQRLARRGTMLVLFVGFLLLSPLRVSAQDSEQSSFLADVFKRTVVDPTTYAPAIIAYHATSLDWKTSQPLFQNGFYEHNQRFTVSGFPNDVPLSYGVGNRKILSDALTNLGVSLVSNMASNMLKPRTITPLTITTTNTSLRVLAATWMAASR